MAERVMVTTNISGDVVGAYVDRALLTHNLRIANDAARSYKVRPGQKAFALETDTIGIICSADKHATINSILRSWGLRTSPMRRVQPE